MVEEAAGTKLYESKKQNALKTIEKKDAKLKEIDDVIWLKFFFRKTCLFYSKIRYWKKKSRQLWRNWKKNEPPTWNINDWCAKSSIWATWSLRSSTSKLWYTRCFKICTIQKHKKMFDNYWWIFLRRPKMRRKNASKIYKRKLNRLRTEWSNVNKDKLFWRRKFRRLRRWKPGYSDLGWVFPMNCW